MTTATQPGSAVAVIEQSIDDASVEWSLDAYQPGDFNRLVPVETIMIPTDLLRPVVQVVRLNPDEKAGDVYHSNDMPNGHAAPTRVALRKLATAAGISFIDERRVDDGRDPDVIEVTTVAEMLLPTGQRIRATGSKRIDLNAQTWASPAQRAKYKSFFQEQVASRAQNRAIRALLSLRGSYPVEVYRKPFAVVSFAPNMAHPEVRARILEGMAPIAAQLYGGPAAAQLAASEVKNVSPAPEEDPAPTTPTVLPGEKLARAGDVEEAPAWLQPTAAPAAAKPDFATTIRDSAAEAEDHDALAGTDDLAKLGQIFAGWDQSLITAGIRALWPERDGEGRTLAISRPSIGQVGAIAKAHESLGHEAFERAWRSFVDAVVGAAA